jgi:hypothetical protein
MLETASGHLSLMLATRGTLYDAPTTSCRDALSRNGINTNAGAGSTVSYLIARCEIAAFGALKAQLPNGLQVPTK